MKEPKSITHWRANATFFIIGQFISMFGSMLVSYAITWHITMQEQSGVWITVFTCATMLPMVFISPLAGVWADRYNRKYLVNISDSVIAVVTCIVAVLYSLGYKNIWFLLTAAVVRSIGQGVQQPAVSALIPQIVPEEHLARFNGIQSTTQSISAFAAPMTAGALLSVLPLEYIFYIDVTTAVVGVATVFFCVKVGSIAKLHEQKAGIQAYYQEMIEGVKFVNGQAWLKSLFTASVIFMVLATPAAMLTPLQVTRTFGNEVWRLTAIEIAFSAGMIVGGILIAMWGGFKNRYHTMIFAGFLFGLSTIGFGLIIFNFWVYLGIMLLCGCSMPMFNTPAMTLMQTKVPPELMGRVFSVLSMLSGMAMPVGMVLFGPLSDIMKIEILLAGTGILLVAGSFYLFTRKELEAIGGAEV